MSEPFAVNQPPHRIGGTRTITLSQAIRERPRQTVHCYRAEPLPVVELQATVRDSAEAVRLFENRLKDRLKLARRGIDDLQYLRRRGLLFQSLARLGDQPRIFHCNDRLRGKVLQQRDLLFGKRTHFLPVDDEVTNKRTVLAQRHRQQSAAAAQLYKSAADRIAGPVGFVLRYICNVDDWFATQ